jgi:ABC-type sugar transport system, permease component
LKSQLAVRTNYPIVLDIDCKRQRQKNSYQEKFSTTDSGIEWPVLNAATLMTSAPLLIGFLLFQRQFVQSFMRAGIK